MFNLYSLGHFLLWLFIGQFFLNSWFLFFLFSVGWEFLEMILPFKFTIESFENKLSDIIVNCFGFYVGKYLKKNLFDKVSFFNIKILFKQNYNISNLINDI